MSLTQVIKTELYKNSRRKSSLMLVIPMVLVIAITFGFSQGIIKLNLTVGNTDAYSCMDFVCIIWNVLSGLGIVGILLVMFAAYQFSGEIERGQIKLMLLRIGKRSTVVIGKYLATVIVAGASIAGTILTCIVSYYLFVAHSSKGTGTFASTIEGLSTWNVWTTIGLQVFMYLILIGITFLSGLFAAPFISFIVTIITMYVGNYLAGAENIVSKLLPAYWSNQLMQKGTAPDLRAFGSVGFTMVLTVCIIVFVMMIFRKQDVK